MFIHTDDVSVSKKGLSPFERCPLIRIGLTACVWNNNTHYKKWEMYVHVYTFRIGGDRLKQWPVAQRATLAAESEME